MEMVTDDEIRFLLTIANRVKSNTSNLEDVANVLIYFDVGEILNESFLLAIFHGGYQFEPMPLQQVLERIFDISTKRGMDDEKILEVMKYMRRCSVKKVVPLVRSSSHRGSRAKHEMRLRTITAMRGKGEQWSKIADTLHSLEGTKVTLGALVLWTKKHVPGLVRTQNKRLVA